MGRTKQLARKLLIPGKQAKRVKAETSQGIKRVPHQRKETSAKRKERVQKRAKAGVVALREIRAYQKTTELLIPRAPFQRLVKELMRYFGPGIDKIRADAVVALQEAAEAYLVGLLEDVNAACIHSGHITIGVKDMSLAQRLRGEGQ